MTSTSHSSLRPTRFFQHICTTLTRPWSPIMRTASACKTTHMSVASAMSTAAESPQTSQTDHMGPNAASEPASHAHAPHAADRARADTSRPRPRPLRLLRRQCTRIDQRSAAGADGLHARGSRVRGSGSAHVGQYSAVMALLAMFEGTALTKTMARSKRGARGDRAHHPRRLKRLLARLDDMPVTSPATTGLERLKRLLQSVRDARVTA